MTRLAGHKVTIVLIAVWIAASVPRPSIADDWEAVTPDNSHADSTDSSAPAGAPRPTHRGHSNTAGAAPAETGAIVECGEAAQPATPSIVKMVSEINGVWGSDVRVYESVAPRGPHALPGGCVFYNKGALALLLGLRLDLRDQAVLTPMLYAIFAHEVGHEVHGDFESSRAGVPDQIKELEADRFAGYTMKKLNVPAVGLSPYWSMAGDEFGAGSKHGTSQQRVAAFKEGWHMAEWNRAENSQSVGTANEESVAPEDSSEAP